MQRRIHLENELRDRGVQDFDLSLDVVERLLGRELYEGFIGYKDARCAACFVADFHDSADVARHEAASSRKLAPARCPVERGTMKGDIALAGFVLTAAEWKQLDARSRMQLMAAAMGRPDLWRESGRHDELLRKSGRYASFYRLQLAEQAPAAAE